MMTGTPPEGEIVMAWNAGRIRYRGASRSSSRDSNCVITTFMT
jgi:hypothetical protein